VSLLRNGQTKNILFTSRRYQYFFLSIMGVAQAAYVEPLPLEGYIFGPDIVLDFYGSLYDPIS
jgi:hypothetical protein